MHWRSSVLSRLESQVQYIYLHATTHVTCRSASTSLGSPGLVDTAIGDACVDSGVMLTRRHGSSALAASVGASSSSLFGCLDSHSACNFFWLRFVIRDQICLYVFAHEHYVRILRRSHLTCVVLGSVAPNLLDSLASCRNSN